jgi:hypothetical protein
MTQTTPPPSAGLPLLLRECVCVRACVPACPGLEPTSDGADSGNDSFHDSDLDSGCDDDDDAWDRERPRRGPSPQPRAGPPEQHGPAGARARTTRGAQPPPALASPGSSTASVSSAGPAAVASPEGPVAPAWVPTVLQPTPTVSQYLEEMEQRVRLAKAQRARMAGPKGPPSECCCALACATVGTKEAVGRGGIWGLCCRWLDGG